MCNLLRPRRPRRRRRRLPLRGLCNRIAQDFACVGFASETGCWELQGTAWWWSGLGQCGGGVPTTATCPSEIPECGSCVGSAPVVEPRNAAAARPPARQCQPADRGLELGRQRVALDQSGSGGAFRLTAVFSSLPRSLVGDAKAGAGVLQPPDPDARIGAVDARRSCARSLDIGCSISGSRAAWPVPRKHLVAISRPLADCASYPQAPVRCIASQRWLYATVHPPPASAA